MSTGHLYVLLREVSIQVLCTFFSWISCLQSDELFTYIGDQTSLQCILGKYVLLYGQFPFHFDDGFFSHIESFYIYFCLDGKP